MLCPGPRQRYFPRGGQETDVEVLVNTFDVFGERVSLEEVAFLRVVLLPRYMQLLDQSPWTSPADKDEL